MANKLCMRCYISGKVQGVWFRASAKDQAEELKLNGWARNMPDGSVEVFACGTETELGVFYAWLQHGPKLAKVDEYTRVNVSWEEYMGFDIL